MGGGVSGAMYMEMFNVKKTLASSYLPFIGYIYRKRISMDIITPSENELLEALNRSGYLLESRISKILSCANFFIETNQVIEDPFTGKNREIDLIAEYKQQTRQPNNLKCYTNARFVFEIKNNAAPFVLLTDFEHSPYKDDCEGMKEYLTVPSNIQYWTGDSYYELLINERSHSIFTQYCSFSKKKNEEIMASHPDNIYEGLSKITQFCEENIGQLQESSDGYLRHILYLPVLLLRDDLFELKHNNNGKESLSKVDCSTLVYSYHANSKPTKAFIFVVTEKGMPDFINSVIAICNKVEEQMIEKRKKAQEKNFNLNPNSLI